MRFFILFTREVNFYGFFPEDFVADTREARYMQAMDWKIAFLRDQ